MVGAGPLFMLRCDRDTGHADLFSTVGKTAYDFLVPASNPVTTALFLFLIALASKATFEAKMSGWRNVLTTHQPVQEKGRDYGALQHA